MAKKEFTYRGKTLVELQQMDLKEFLQLLTSRKRRTLLRGLTEQQKKIMARVEKGQNNIKTHNRELVILPQFVGKTFNVHNGKEFVKVEIREEMIGHVLGEFAMTRRISKHSSPGVMKAQKK